MSRSPHSSPPQDTVGSEGSERQRSECIAGLRFLSHGLVNCVRRPAPASAERAFFCRTDLESLWKTRPQARAPRPLDLVFHVLSDAQRHVLFNKLLLFISFLVYVDISPDWCVECEAKLFKPKWHERSVDLEFEDTKEPLSEEQLLGLGLSPTQAVKWEAQYMFRPARITLNDDDLDEWIQVIDRREPLPFELHRDGKARNSYSTGYHSEHGTVKLYRISSEYVSLVPQDTDGSENWAPTQSPGPLRVVKTFVADHRALREAKNMNFLKQSLTINRSIAIHDAIIGRDEGDHTRINIILPWAQLGDLSQFLVDGADDTHPGLIQRYYDFAQNFPRVEKDQHFIQSLLRQSTQLAGALRFLHEGFDTKADDWHISCAHMDLKPENILIFQSPDSTVGKWKISDFGISVFRAKPKIHTHKTGAMGSLGDYFARIQANLRPSPGRQLETYQAPEIEFPMGYENTEDAEDLQRRSDIWSFGAILAEVLAYAFGRSATVKDFRQRRRQLSPGRDSPDSLFYTPGPPHDPSRCLLRLEVADWLDGFRYEAPPQSATGCLRCWGFYVKRILVVDARSRPDAKQVDQWLQTLQRHNTSPEDEGCVESFPTARLPAAPSPRQPSHIPFLVSTPELSQMPDYDNIHDRLGEKIYPPGSIPSPSVGVGSQTETSDYDDVEQFTRLGLSPEPRRGSNTTRSSDVRDSFTLLSAARSSEVSGVSLASTDVFDFDVDAAGCKVAYLTRLGVEIFQLNPSEPMTPHKHGEIPILGKKMEWRGVRVSGQYLTIWGYINRRSEVKVYDVSENIPRQFAASDDLPDFDHKRRLAVSRLGFVALIKHDLILVLDIRDGTVRQFPLIVMPKDPNRPRPGSFLEVSFDSTGSLLFAWGNRDIYGVLFVYEFASAGMEPASLIFEGKYTKNFSGDDVVIIPSDGQLECIVALHAKTMFVGCVPSDRFEEATFDGPFRRTQPQHFPDLPKGVDPVAACIFNGSVIMLQQQSTRKKMPVAVQKTGQLCQVPIRTSRRLDLHSPKAVMPLRERPKVDLNLNVAAKIGLVQIEGSLAVVVCHSNGKVEWVPLQNKVAPLLSPS